MWSYLLPEGKKARAKQPWSAASNLFACMRIASSCVGWFQLPGDDPNQLKLFDSLREIARPAALRFSRPAFDASDHHAGIQQPTFWPIALLGFRLLI